LLRHSKPMLFSGTWSGMNIVSPPIGLSLCWIEVISLPWFEQFRRLRNTRCRAIKGTANVIALPRSPAGMSV
jgi:hypothetical protein